jgi:hypothetical protein
MGVDPGILALLRGALERYAPAETGEFMESFWDHPASRRTRSTTTRQARHARMLRASYMGVAGSLLLAGSEDAYVDLLFHPEFARMRPQSAPVHNRLMHILGTEGEISPAVLERIWDKVLPRWLDLARRARFLDRDRLLVIQSGLMALFLGPAILNEHFEHGWRHLWKEAKRRGILDNPHLRMQLAIMGSYAGRCGPHVDWLMDPRLRSFDVADTLCYVRRDRSPLLLDQTAASIRGDTPSDARWNALVESAPLSTWRRLADYVRACMRFKGHFSNEGLVLMVLCWVEDIAQRGLILREGDGSSSEVRQLLAELRRIESVEILEKSRFWKVIEGTPDGPVRQRLVGLWKENSAVKES